MNHVVAYELLTTELAAYRGLGFESLRDLVGETTATRKRANDGVEYDITIVIRWHPRERAGICVDASIAETCWNGPHDSLNETLTVARSAADIC